MRDLRSTQPLDRSISSNPSAIPVGTPFKKPRFSMIANTWLAPVSVGRCVHCRGGRIDGRVKRSGDDGSRATAGTGRAAHAASTTGGHVRTVETTLRCNAYVKGIRATANPPTPPGAVEENQAAVGLAHRSPPNILVHAAFSLVVFDFEKIVFRIRKPHKARIGKKLEGSGAAVAVVMVTAPFG